MGLSVYLLADFAVLYGGQHNACLIVSNMLIIKEDFPQQATCQVLAKLIGKPWD